MEQINFKQQELGYKEIMLLKMKMALGEARRSLRISSQSLKTNDLFILSSSHGIEGYLTLAEMFRQPQMRSLACREVLIPGYT